jgi:hypothetical protein
MIEFGSDGRRLRPPRTRTRATGENSLVLLTVGSPEAVPLSCRAQRHAASLAGSECSHLTRSRRVRLFPGDSCREHRLASAIGPRFRARPPSRRAGDATEPPRARGPAAHEYAARDRRSYCCRRASRVCGAGKRSPRNRSSARLQRRRYVGEERSGAVATTCGMSCAFVGGVTRGELDPSPCPSRARFQRTLPKWSGSDSRWGSTFGPEASPFEPRLVLQSGTPPSPILWRLHSRK